MAESVRGREICFFFLSFCWPDYRSLMTGRNTMQSDSFRPVIIAGFLLVRKADHVTRVLEDNVDVDLC